MGVNEEPQSPRVYADRRNPGISLERAKKEQNRIEAYVTYLASLDKAVKDGKMTEEARRRSIALRMHAQDIRIQAHQERKFTDQLTGFGNKEGFNEMLNELIQNEKKIAGIYADLDRFKQVNDTFGHHAGDIVIIGLFNRINSALRPDQDYLSRWGGDEIAILLQGINSVDDLNNIGERVRKSVNVVPFSFLKNEKLTTIPLTISAGGTIRNHGESGRDFMERMDKNLYEAKESGRNRFVVK